MVRSNLARFALLALAAHSVNAAYCASIGDTSQPTWAEAPDWQKESAQMGVEHLLANPELTAADMHALWCDQKIGTGWKFGPIKDADKKEHPCLVPYDQLPDLQKTKDHLFRGIVLALAAVTEEYDEAAAPPAPAAPQAPAALMAGTVPGFTPIKYVGRRPTYKEGTYGTGIVFEQGQVKMVPSDKAKLLLKHPDVYVVGEASGFATAEKIPEGKDGYKPPTDEEENARMDALQALSTMNRAAMVKFAKLNFGQDLSAETPAPELRSQIVSLIDRFGLAK